MDENYNVLKDALIKVKKRHEYSFKSLTLIHTIDENQNTESFKVSTKISNNEQLDLEEASALYLILGDILNKERPVIEKAKKPHQDFSYDDDTL